MMFWKSNFEIQSDLKKYIDGKRNLFTVFTYFFLSFCKLLLLLLLLSFVSPQAWLQRVTFLLLCGDLIKGFSACGDLTRFGACGDLTDFGAFVGNFVTTLGAIANTILV